MSEPRNKPGVAFWATVVVVVGLFYVAHFGVLIATGTIGRFFWLFQQASSIFPVAWPVTVPLAFWVAYSFSKSWKENELNNHQLLWLVPFVILPISMLVWGAVFTHSRGQGFERWQLTIVHWMFYFTVAIAFLAIVSNRGRRSFVTATILLSLLFSFSCSFTAGSSVTGDWL